MNGSTMRTWMVLAAVGLAASLVAVAPAHADNKGRKGSNGFENSGVKLSVSKAGRKSTAASRSGSSNRGQASSSSRGGGYDRGHSSSHGRDYGHGHNYGHSHHDHDHDHHRSSFSISIGSGYRYGYCPPGYSYRSGWYAPSYRYTPSYSYGYGYSTPYVYSYPSTTVNTYVNEAPSGGYQVWQEDIRDGQVQSRTVTEPEYPAYNPGPPSASPGGIARGEAEQAVAAAPDTVNVDRQRQLDDWHESGWNAIGRRNYTEARDHFARLAGNEVERARGKVGFAVSSALLEREAAAVWAMRRAFITEPEALGFLATSDEAAAVLHELEAELAGTAGAVPEAGQADRWFLVASVAYLRHDIDAARDAAGQARAAGDHSAALDSLEDLLDQ